MGKRNCLASVNALLCKALPTPDGNFRTPAYDLVIREDRLRPVWAVTNRKTTSETEVVFLVVVTRRGIEPLLPP